MHQSSGVYAGRNTAYLQDFFAGFSSPFKLPSHMVEHGLKGISMQDSTNI